MINKNPTAISKLSENYDEIIVMIVKTYMYCNSVNKYFII